jgi:uncharacterized protein YjiS (DUF1127 family)
MHTIVSRERLPDRPAAPAERGSATVRPGIASLLRYILTWAERARQRRALQALDEWVLKDIGLSRADVMREYEKSFWQE